MTGCLTSTGSWPNFIPGGESQPWQVRTCWFVGIIFGLASILAAADQTIRLHRISAHRNAPRRIRILIKGNTGRKGGQIRPSRVRMFIWQLPVFLLSCAAVSMMTGIWILVWTATRENGSFVWKENAQVSDWRDFASSGTNLYPRVRLCFRSSRFQWGLFSFGLRRCCTLLSMTKTMNMSKFSGFTLRWLGDTQMADQLRAA